MGEFLFRIVKRTLQNICQKREHQVWYGWGPMANGWASLTSPLLWVKHLQVSMLDRSNCLISLFFRKGKISGCCHLHYHLLLSSSSVELHSLSASPDDCSSSCRNIHFDALVLKNYGICLRPLQSGSQDKLRYPKPHEYGHVSFTSFINIDLTGLGNV